LADQGIRRSVWQGRDLTIFEELFSGWLSRIDFFQQILALNTASKELSDFGSGVVGKFR
jgi:hypothetical protein